MRSKWYGKNFEKWLIYLDVDTNGTKHHIVKFHTEHVTNIGDAIHTGLDTFTEIKIFRPTHKKNVKSTISWKTAGFEAMQTNYIHLVTSLMKQIFCLGSETNETMPRNMPPSLYGVISACNQSNTCSFSTIIGVASRIWLNVAVSIVLVNASILALNDPAMSQKVETMRMYLCNARWSSTLAAFPLTFFTYCHGNIDMEIGECLDQNGG